MNQTSRSTTSFLRSKYLWFGIGVLRGNDLYPCSLIHNRCWHCFMDLVTIVALMSNLIRQLKRFECRLIWGQETLLIRIKPNDGARQSLFVFLGSFFPPFLTLSPWDGPLHWSSITCLFTYHVHPAQISHMHNIAETLVCSHTTLHNVLKPHQHTDKQG